MAVDVLATYFYCLLESIVRSVTNHFGETGRMRLLPEKLWVTHAPGMLGSFSSKETAGFMILVWDDILTPLYIDRGVNITYDILDPGVQLGRLLVTPVLK